MCHSDLSLKIDFNVNCFFLQNFQFLSSKILQKQGPSYKWLNTEETQKTLTSFTTFHNKLKLFVIKNLKVLKILPKFSKFYHHFWWHSFHSLDSRKITQTLFIIKEFMTDFGCCFGLAHLMQWCKDTIMISILLRTLVGYFVENAFNVMCGKCHVIYEEWKPWPPLRINLTFTLTFPRFINLDFHRIKRIFYFKLNGDELNKYGIIFCLNSSFWCLIR